MSSRDPGPEQVVEQMKEATARLREQRWMVSPMTTAAVEPDEQSSDTSS